MERQLSLCFRTLLVLALLATLPRTTSLCHSFICGSTLTNPLNTGSKIITPFLHHRRTNDHAPTRRRHQTNLHASSAEEELNNAEISRYSRYLVLGDVGVAGQKALKNSSVLVIGAGGLGSPYSYSRIECTIECLKG